MRLVIAVLLLVGSVVGQQTPKRFGQTHLDPVTNKPEQVWHVGDDGVQTSGGLDQWHPHTVTFSPSGVTEDVEMMRHAKLGDCYRVTKGAALEKVDQCYDRSELVLWNKDLTSPADKDPGINHTGATMYGLDSVDIPAVEESLQLPEPKELCPVGFWLKYKGGNKFSCQKVSCPNLDRILIGPDGHGKYFCHLPQVQP